MLDRLELMRHAREHAQRPVGGAKRLNGHRARTVSVDTPERRFDIAERFVPVVVQSHDRHFVAGTASREDRLCHRLDDGSARNRHRVVEQQDDLTRDEIARSRWP